MLRAGLGEKSFQLEVMSKPRRGPRVISPEYKYLPVWSLPASSSCVLLELLSAPASIYPLMHPPTHPSMQCLTAPSCLPSVSLLSLIHLVHIFVHPSKCSSGHSLTYSHPFIHLSISLLICRSQFSLSPPPHLYEKPTMYQAFSIILSHRSFFIILYLVT